jgi:ABC-2 type transport system ATP-binding protein
MVNNVVIVEGLTKKYSRITAVDGVSFNIGEGEIFGFLGPNGAGKTTTIRMLLTLIKPTAGRITIFGVDALTHPAQVRQIAGYVPQDVSVDGDLTGYENLLLYARLYGVPRTDREKRIGEVLESMGLQDRANDMASTYSGGMMRRLEVAQALVNRPKMLFLDEPSIGLDPNAKNVIWRFVKNLRNEFGTTIFITTHDMNEADTLCDRIAFIDKGQLVSVDAPSKLKSTVGGDMLTISSKTPGCSATLEKLGYPVVSNQSECSFELVVSDGEHVIPHLLETLRSSGVEVESVSLKRPTLDDVFQKYTGAKISEDQTWVAARKTRRTFRKLRR